MSRRLVASIVLAACSGPAASRAPDDAALPDAALADAASADAWVAPLDAPTGFPDLQFVVEEMAGNWVVTSDVFAPDDCAVAEGCVGAAGRRTLLRFDTVTANRGSGELVVGVPPPPGESNAVFQWSACHKHHHVANYASYELVGPTGTVLTARKQSFCLEDGEQVQPGAPPTGYTCLNQGISRGWADVYGRYLACQWIDVTDIAPGAYTLRIVVNPLRTIAESSYDNNLFTFDVRF